MRHALTCILLLCSIILTAKPRWSEIEDRHTYKYVNTADDGTITYAKTEVLNGENVYIMARVKNDYLEASVYLRRYESDRQAENRFWEISSNYLVYCKEWEKPELFGYIFVYDGFIAVVRKNKLLVQIIIAYD